jgi:hypothetical protein
MNKRDKIDLILSLVKQATEEFLEHEEQTGDDIGVEEIIIAATEHVLNNAVHTVQYIMPVATVDRSKVSFYIGDDMEVPIYGDTDDEN